MANWPQWFFAVLIAYGMIYNLYDDGKKGSVTSLISTLIVFPAQAIVLYYGGFWSVWGIAP